MINLILYLIIAGFFFGQVQGKTKFGRICGALVWPLLVALIIFSTMKNMRGKKNES